MADERKPGEAWTMVKAVRAARADVLPPGPARMLALTIATHASPDGVTFIGVKRLAAEMGYQSPDASELTESARVSFWRVFRQLVKLEVARKEPCSCIDRTHPFHLRLIADTLGNKKASGLVAKLLHKKGGARSKKATAGVAKSLRVPPMTSRRIEDHPCTACTESPTETQIASARARNNYKPTTWKRWSAQRRERWENAVTAIREQEDHQTHTAAADNDEGGNDE